MPFKFENLEVWKDSIELTGIVHEVSARFPKGKSFVLTAQIKRAADSVSLNIAEGSTGQSNPEFKKFLGYAIRSAVEVVSCIFVVKRRKIISEKRLQRNLQFYRQACKKDSGFKKRNQVNRPWSINS